jgi:hypothetical protein
LDAEAIAALGGRAETVLGKLADGFDSISTAHAEKGRKPDAPQADEGEAAPTPAKFTLDAPFSFGLKLDEAADAYIAPDGQVFERQYVETVMQPQEAAIETMRSVLFEIQQERMGQQVEGFFNAIADEYGALYGTGETAFLNPDSAEYKARMEALGKAGELADSYRKAGRSFTVQQVLDEALSIHAKDFHKTAAQNSLKQQVRNRQGQFIQRASARIAPEAFKTPKERAIAAATAKINELGLANASE